MPHTILYMLINRTSAKYHVLMNNTRSLRNEARNNIRLPLSGEGERDNTELKTTELKAVFRGNAYRSILGRQ